MSRWIDADALLAKYSHSFMTAQTDYAEGVRDVLKDINDAPSIDIVRCKECRYYIDFIGEQFINAPTLCGRLSTLDNYIVVNADDFCSYGKRKESE